MTHPAVRPHLLSLVRQILQQALPNWVAKLLAVGMMIADTVIVGHYSTPDLAAVAIGGSYYVSVVVMLTGTLQALSPTLAHKVGAGRLDELAPTLQQGLILAMGLAALGMMLMWNPQPFFEWAQVPSDTAAGATAYLQATAWGLPALMFYRSFYEFSNALRITRPLMVISALVTFTHIPLAWSLTHGIGPWQGLGGLGCGISTAVVNTVAMACSLAYLKWHQAFDSHAPWRSTWRIQWAELQRLLKLGVPMGLSSFVDISSFTLIAILVAKLGAETVSGHRVVANMTGFIYMLPLSISIATLVQVGQAAGAHNLMLARKVVWAGVCLTGVLSVTVGLALWGLRQPLVAWSTADPAVQQVALQLIGLLAIYQGLDALQTLAAYALRGFKVTLVPMLIHTLCMWGIGLFGGHWLTFSAPWRAGVPDVAGFWEGCVAATAAACICFGTLLLIKTRERRLDQPASSLGQA